MAPTNVFSLVFTMKYLFSVLTVLALLMPVLRAEPKEYSGTLAGRPVKATLNWLDEKNVAGVIATEDGTLQVSIAGQNTASGQIKAVLSVGVESRGTVKLTKTTTVASIIWSGKMVSPEGQETGVLELQRPR